MKRSNLWLGLVLILVVALGLSACASTPEAEKSEPVELVDQGDGFNLVILTEKAAERRTGFTAELDELPGTDDADDTGVSTLYYSVADSEAGLVTGQRAVVEVSLMGDKGPQLTVPVAALLYDLNGETWIYINTESLQFLRVPVVVDYIMDDTVVLLEGPPAGTKVAVVGVAELHGADTGVGK
jgi:hypothetical protein